MPQAALAPILIATSIAGVGLAAAGTIQQTQAAKKSQAYNQQVISDEQQQAALQKQQADLQAERYRMQVIRQSNIARGLAVSNASGTNAQYGSGLQGGYGQIAGESNVALGNSFQNQSLTNQLYGINTGINSARVGQSQAMSGYYSGAGMSSLGGALINIAPTAQRLSAGFGTSSSGFGPGMGLAGSGSLYSGTGSLY